MRQEPSSKWLSILMKNHSSSTPPHENLPIHKTGTSSRTASVIQTLRVNMFRIRQQQDVVVQIVASLLMSHAGLSNRIIYGSSYFAILRDVCSVVLENVLLISAWQCTCCHVRGGGCQLRRRQQRRSKQQQQPQRSHSRRIQWCCCCWTAVVLTTLLTCYWIVASWGDFVFELQTHGVIPSLWIIAAGLKDPAVHLNVQLQTQQDTFVGGLIQILFGLASGMAVLLLYYYYCWWKTRKRAVALRETKHHHDFVSTTSRSNHDHNSVNVNATRTSNSHNNKTKHLCVRTLNILGNVALILFLYLHCEAWAPVTNLTYAIIGSLVLVPPAGSASSKSRLGHSASSTKSDWFKTKTGEKRQLPNVIVVVHESLSGAALKTTRGKNATPFYQSLRNHDPNMYDFTSARTVAGTTPIATPAILTGLLPYDKEGVSTILQSNTLATDLRTAGYATGSFVSYGTDWSGSQWNILNDLLMTDFDHIIGPKETNEPRVNEFGMDDRVTIKYFRDWIMSLRKGPSAYPNQNVTSSSYDSIRNQRDRLRGTAKNITERKPFFAAIVFNNQHFPHLQHETYSGAPDCVERDYNDDRDYSDPDYFENGADHPCWTWGSDSSVSRYYSSLRTMDESLRDMFAALNVTGDLSNTIIMGAGDHGETPGFSKRLSDIDAPIIEVPLWMYIPEDLLSTAGADQHLDASAKEDSTASSEEGPGHRAATFLRSNVDRTVSVLDIVPTLRDLLGFFRLYTLEQKHKCVTGMSLVNQLVPRNRIVVGWGAKPLDGINVGVFSAKSKALLYYPRDVPKSHVSEFKFNNDDPFFTLYEKNLKEMDADEMRKWKKDLEEQGWLDHELLRIHMPTFAEEIRSLKPT